MGANSSAALWCPADCPATREHASDGTRSDCVGLDLHSVWTLRAEANRDLRLCVIHLCSDLNASHIKQQSAPGGADAPVLPFCRPTFSASCPYRANQARTAPTNQGSATNLPLFPTEKPIPLRARTCLRAHMRAGGCAHKHLTPGRLDTSSSPHLFTVYSSKCC